MAWAGQTYFPTESPVAVMLDDADVYFAFIFAFDYALYFYAAESRLKYFFGPMQVQCNNTMALLNSLAISPSPTPPSLG